MADDKIKLPRSSYEELSKIIKAYGRYDKPVSLDEISHATGINRTVVSGNNGFLSYIGVIEGARNKQITNPGRILSHALMHEIPEEVEKGWRAIVHENDFLSKMLLAVRIRKGMEVNALQSHIAYSAGLPKNGATSTGARAVIDILRSSGLVSESDDKIVPVESQEERREESSTTSVRLSPTTGNLEITSNRPTFEIGRAPTGFGGVSINIQLRIDAKPEELDGLGSKLRQLLEDLTPHDDEQKPR